MRVLLVEDDKKLASYIEKGLKEAGFAVDRAEQGGWELVRVRVTPDGTRRVVLRRKIIRAVRTA